MSIFLRLRTDGWYVVTNGKICLRAFAFCWSADCLPAKLTSDIKHFVRIAARGEARFLVNEL